MKADIYNSNPTLLGRIILALLTLGIYILLYINLFKCAEVNWIVTIFIPFIFIFLLLMILVVVFAIINLIYRCIVWVIFGETECANILEIIDYFIIDKIKYFYLWIFGDWRKRKEK